MPLDDNRIGDHGDMMATDSSMNSQGKSHCCRCWQYTDDATAKTQERCQLTQSAYTIIASASVLAVENSAAFKAADDYLAALFKAATPLAAPRF